MTEDLLERWLDAVLATPGLTGLKDRGEARRVLLDDADLCAGTVIPEGVSGGDLKPWHWALVDGDGTFDTRAAGKGPGVSFTIEDTAGCSCTQILAAMAFGAGQEKHGCSTGTMQDWVALIGE